MIVSVCVIVAFLYCYCLLFVLLLLLLMLLLFGVCFIVAFGCYCYGLVLVLLCGQLCCWLLFLVFVFVLLYVCGMFCGHRDGKKTLDIREWTCPVCHTHHDRDMNASKNILAEALRIREAV